MSFCKECGGYSEQPIRNEIEALTQALQIAKDALEKIRIQKGSSYMIVTAEEALKDIEKVME